MGNFFWQTRKEQYICSLCSYSAKKQCFVDRHLRNDHRKRSRTKEPPVVLKRPAQPLTKKRQEPMTRKLRSVVSQERKARMEKKEDICKWILDIQERKERADAAVRSVKKEAHQLLAKAGASEMNKKVAAAEKAVQLNVAAIERLYSDLVHFLKEECEQIDRELAET